MKVLYSIFMICTLGVITLQAQVYETRLTMGKGTQNALAIDLPGATSSTADKEWKNYMKDKYGRVKGVKRSKEVVVENAQVIGMGTTDPVNIYGRAEQIGSDARMIMWLEKGGTFVSSENDPAAYREGVHILQDFAQHVEVTMVGSELDEQQKVLSKLEKDLAKLQKENTNLNKTIEKAKATIAKAEEDIVKNNEAQKAKAAEIEAQKKLVDEVQNRHNEAKSNRDQE